MGLRSCGGSNNAGLHMVYCEDHVMEVTRQMDLSSLYKNTEMLQDSISSKRQQSWQ